MPSLERESEVFIIKAISQGRAGNARAQTIYEFVGVRICITYGRTYSDNDPRMIM